MSTSERVHQWGCTTHRENTYEACLDCVYEELARVVAIADELRVLAEERLQKISQLDQRVLDLEEVANNEEGYPC